MTGSADARWAAAAQLAGGHEDIGQRARRRRVILGIIALVVLGTVLGLVLVLVLMSDAPASDSEADAYRDIVLITVFGSVGLGLSFGSLVWGWSTGRFVTRWRAIISPLNWSETRAVRRQLAGKQPADPERLPIVLAIDRQFQRVTQLLVPLCTGLLIFDIGQALAGDEPFMVALNVTLAALFGILVVHLVVVYRRTARFIRKHSSASETHP